MPAHRLDPGDCGRGPASRGISRSPPWWPCSAAAH